MATRKDNRNADSLVSLITDLMKTVTSLDNTSAVAHRLAKAMKQVSGADFAVFHIDDTPFEKGVTISSERSGQRLAYPRSIGGFGARHPGDIQEKTLPWKELGLDMNGEAVCLVCGLTLEPPRSGAVAACRANGGFTPEEKGKFLTFSVAASLIYANVDLKKRVSILTERDPLTLLYHSEAFYEHLSKAVATSRNKNLPVSAMIIDIDNFRSYNDRFGHSEGNLLLQEIASLLREACRRSTEIPCRYSGEEFCILLVGEGPEKAKKMAETISGNIKRLSEEGRTKAEVTVSIGLATLPNNAKNETELILAVDNALYYAKTMGPDNIYNFDDLPAQSTEFKPMLEALSQTLIQHASEEADEEGMSVVEKLRDELEMAVSRTRVDEPTTEMISREAVFSLAATVDARDIYTRGHSEQVATYAHQMAEAMELSREEQEIIYIAGFLHDIGKIIIPDYILNKSEQLLPGEWTPIREHPAAGVRILEPFEGLKSVLPIVLHHHERWNGKGYPLGLKGKKIPLGARIIGVADAFDAMTSNRCYRSEKSVDDAVRELRDNSGTQFDPDVVKAFLSLGFAEVLS